MSMVKIITDLKLSDLTDSFDFYLQMGKLMA